MHGYVLNEHLGGRSPLSLKKPTAYNLLARMEADGWIAGRDESTGDRTRTVYSVTAAGEQAFFRLLREQLSSYAPGETPAMVSVGFLDALERGEALDLLRRRRDEAAAYRASLQPQSDSADAHGHAGSTSLLIEYARRLADLDIDFLDRIIDHLEMDPTKGDTK